MKFLAFIVLLQLSLIINAQESGLEKKQIILDLKPDFNSELKQQEKATRDGFFQAAEQQAGEKTIFEHSPPAKHQFSLGVAAGNTVKQEDIKPLTITPLKPKMTTVFDK